MGKEYKTWAGRCAYIHKRLAQITEAKWTQIGITKAKPRAIE